MKWSSELFKAADDHAKDIGEKGLLSHKGSDGSTYKDRIEKHCKWGGTIFEAIDYGERDTAQEVIIAWLVDDGVKRRLHRQNIMDENIVFAAF